MQKKMMASAKTVDEYIKQFPLNVQKALENLRRTIKAAAPDAEERIGYGMPGYKHYGWLVFFGGFKDHCSFFPASKAVIHTFRKELKSFEAKAGTIHFTPEHPLPAAIVKKIVKARMKENELVAERRRKRSA
jgi:uncharacterized protein YdhG (YjbR/CyaY superfamily)